MKDKKTWLVKNTQTIGFINGLIYMASMICFILGIAILTILLYTNNSYDNQFLFISVAIILIFSIFAYNFSITFQYALVDGRNKKEKYIEFSW